MSDDISVDFGRLSAAEAELAGSQAAIGGALHQLDDDLRPLLATWTGDGGHAYTVQQQRWNAAAADLNETLRLIHQAIGQANASYQATDRSVAAAWSGA